MTHILCTKSPKRFRYAESTEGPVLPFFSFSGSVLVVSSSSSCSLRRDRNRSFSDEASAVLAPLVCVIESSNEFERVCEWECVWPVSSSPPRTLRVFSMTKKLANPAKIPNLNNGKWVLCASGSLATFLTQWVYSSSLQPLQSGHRHPDVRPWMSEVPSARTHLTAILQSRVNNIRSVKLSVLCTYRKCRHRVESVGMDLRGYHS